MSTMNIEIKAFKINTLISELGCFNFPSVFETIKEKQI